jgi:hypothetical protein
MADRMHGASSPNAALRLYIEGNCAFIASHRTEMRALLEIFMNGGFGYGAGEERAVLSPLEEILRAGQQAGEFRSFDVTVMATLIQRAVDGLPFLLANQPHLDIAAYAREVALVFDLATRLTR